MSLLKNQPDVFTPILIVSRNARAIALVIGASLLCQQSLLAQDTITVSGTSKITEIASTNSLQDRLVALTQLIHYRFRGDESLLEKRRSEVETALSDWNAIDRPSSTDHQQMTAWLEIAIRSSMPGRSGKLPRPPHFSSGLVQHPTAPIVNPTAAPSRRTPRERIEPIPDVEPIPDLVKPTLLKPATPRRSKWSRHPSAAPLKWSDPFSDEPQSSTNPFLQENADRYETRRLTFGDGKGFGNGKGITVDLAELSAEVRGYNAALRSLGQRLSQKREVSTATLTAIAAELEHLETERRFLDLYREGLSEAEQRSLPSSPSAELVYEIVRRKTAKRLHRISPSKNEERRALEGLAARLARL